MRVPAVFTGLLLAACAVGDDLPIVPPPSPPTPSFRLEIFPFGGKSVGLAPGSAIQLMPHISVIGHPGEVLPPSQPISYTSRNPTVVSVDGSGRVAALAVGSSTIHATTVHEGQLLLDTLAVVASGGICSTELTATVTPVAPVLTVGQRFTPTISLTTCGGRITLTDPVTWSALDPDIVSVNPVTGETVALRAGSTVVKATIRGTLQVSGIVVSVN